MAGWSKLKAMIGKYLPFVAHLIVAAGVTAFILGYIGGRTFPLAHRPIVIESDGSTSTHGPHAVQSDITTIISIAATLTRLAGSWWYGSFLWRGVIFCMEEGGISLKGVQRLLKRYPPLPKDFGRKKSLILVSVFLVIIFGIDFFAPILTGSITWNPAFEYAPGKASITDISDSAGGLSLAGYRTHDEVVTHTVVAATAAANLAWGTSTQVDGSTAPATVMRRVLDNTRFLPINSTVENVVLPYFAVDKFEWIQDPKSELTPAQLSRITADGYSPFFSLAGEVGLLPDNRWGPLSNTHTPEPQIVSETRVLIIRLNRIDGRGVCNSTVIPSDVPSNVQVYTWPHQTDYDCMIMAKLTYTAGRAECQKCRVVVSGIFQNDNPLTPLPDAIATEALALASYVGTHMAFTYYAVPSDFSGLQNKAVEYISRSYQASWSALTKYIGTETGTTKETQYTISIVASRAVIRYWRVYLWLLLHISVVLLGGLFVYLQSNCKHPWVEDPTFATILLDNSKILDAKYWGETDPWDPNAKLPKGLVKLEEGDNITRSMKLDGCPE